jgi:hypothetical protein
MTKVRLDGDYIFVIRDFCTPQECDAFITQSENAGYEDATVTTAAGFVMDKDLRDSARLIVDDVDLAARLWARAEPFMPTRVSGWRAMGFNERLRFYRYDVGQKFAPHSDGYFRRENGERSQFTFMVYLNDGFTGGETRFYSDEGVPHVEVTPERGMALVFLHRRVHEGAPVVEGRKYVMRTDVMYVEAEQES